jgi:type II secretory pathway pseudopilin PulG
MPKTGGTNLNMTMEPGLFVRVHARLHDERGFSLLETIFAVTIMFAALVALAYTATLGFGYQSLSRQRQAANGIANEVMEEVRGLAYEHITDGLLDTDLAGDANIVDCTGTMRLLACTPDAAIPGSGEEIVSNPGLTTAVPLVPHQSSTTPNVNPTRDGITYEWATYVTRDDLTIDAPYRVTVIVTWTGGAVNAPNKLVRVQSLFWSPIGCRNPDTHPFAAPCQPFLYGTATVPQGNITVSGTVSGTSFTSGQLFTPGVSSSAQQEQIEQIQGSWQSTEVTITDGAGTRTAGGTNGSTNADSDPGSLTTTNSRVRCPTEVTCASGTVSSSGSGNSITFTAPAGTTAESDSTSDAVSPNVCPPPTDTAESDALACGGGRVLQGGSLTTTYSVELDEDDDLAGTLVRVQAPASASKVFVNRTAFALTAGCTPAATDDGCMALTANRSVGTVNVGGLPSGLTAPTGWTGANAWNGFFLSLVDYQDSLTGSVGTDSPLPTGTLSGRIYYYNGSGYSFKEVFDPSLNGFSATYTTTESVDGDTVEVTMSTDTTGMSVGSTSLSPTTPSGSITRTDADGQAVPPNVTVRYVIKVNSVTVTDLTVIVKLGTLEVRGIYAQAPVEGT